jgi:DNA-binding NarL/FixJ family response regulator
MSSLRILIADDHDVIRRGLKALLESHPGWKICAEAQTGREAVTQTGALKPDVVILDLVMPDLNGLEAARRIRKESPSTEIMILSVHYSDNLIRDLVGAGVRGYIAKSDAERDLLVAVEALANHKPFFSPRATEVMLRNSTPPRSAVAAVPEGLRDPLTPREREVIQLISAGKSSREISSLLGISVKTAETHRANIMRKLEVHSVSELVRYAVRNQIVEA